MLICCLGNGLYLEITAYNYAYAPLAKFKTLTSCRLICGITSIWIMLYTLPIMLTLCLILRYAYYARNNVDRLGSGLVGSIQLVPVETKCILLKCVFTIYVHMHLREYL